MSRAQVLQARPLEHARALLAEELVRFDEVLQRALEPQQRYLTDVERGIYAGGKRLRPLLLLLSAHAASPSPGSRLPDKAIQAAVSLEMLHVATLIHDDIVDSAPLRRGLPSVHASRGTEIAVLVGDLQFVQAIRGFADAVETTEEMALVRHVLTVGFNLCCGEIDELSMPAGESPEALRWHYLRTMDRKTAQLFGLACESGAALVGSRRRTAFALSRYGRNLGRCFQVMDDLGDLVKPAAASGKARGADLVAGRWSLPLIYAMAALPVGNPVERVMVHGDRSPEAVEAARRAALRSRGFLRAYGEARVLSNEAIECLHDVPKGAYRDVLAAIARHVVDQSHSDL